MVRKYYVKKRNKNISPFFNKILNWAFFFYSYKFSDWIPKSVKINVKDDFLIFLNLPNVDKKSVVIEKINDTITVSGERKKKLPPKREKCLIEISKDNGKFKLTYDITEKTDNSKIEASFLDDLLLIRIPSNLED